MLKMLHASASFLLLFLLLESAKCIDPNDSIFESETSLVHLPILVFSLFIFVASCIHQLIKSFSLAISFGPLLLILAILWGTGAIYSESMKKFSTIVYVVLPEAMAHFYFPILVFQSSLTLDVRIAKKFLVPILIISFPVAILSATLSGILISILMEKHLALETTVAWGLIVTPINAMKIIDDQKRIGSNTKYIRVLLEAESIITLAAPFMVYIFFRGVLQADGTEVIVQTLVFPLQLIVAYVLGKIGCCFMRHLYNEPLLLASTIFPMPLMLHCLFIKFSLPAIFVMGLVMSQERQTSLTKETDRFLLTFWLILLHVIGMLCFVYSGIYFAVYILNYIEFHNYIFIVATFLIMNVSRIVSFVVFSPLVTWVGNDTITYKDMAICAFGNIKHPWILTVMILQHGPSQKVMFLHAVGIFLASTVITASIFPVVVRVAGLLKVSYGRKVNMDNCLKHISDKRDRTMTMLKFDRFLTDVNWPIVQKATELNHPYRDQQLEDADEVCEEYVKYKMKTTCPECRKPLTFTPSYKEYNDMVKDAYLRVLKANKVSFIRQYENGTLTRNALFYLLQAAEFVSSSEKPIMEASVLEKLFKKEGLFNRFCSNHLKQILESIKEDIRPPRRPYRTVCYKIVTHPLFDPSVFLCIILLIVVMILDMIINSTKFEDRLMFFLAYFLFMSAFLTEFVLKVMSYSFISIWEYGVKTYFANKWNRMDFATLIIGALYVFLCLLELVLFGSNEHKTLDWTQRFIQPLQALRLLRLAKMLKSLFPALIRYFDRRIDQNMEFAYDVGKAYVNAKIEVLNLLPLLIDNEKIRNEVRMTLEEGRLAVTKLLGLAQKERPWIAITIKTKQTILTVLKSLKDSVNTLKTSGWVDDFEYRKLLASIAERKRLRSSIKSVKPTTPADILREVPWIGDDDDVIAYLLENVETKRFNLGDVVCKKGEIVEGIYIVLTGLLRVTYKPDPNIVADLNQYGIIPNVDFVPFALDYRHKCEDYVVSGHCVGELCFLTEKPLQCVVTAETHSFLYLLPRAHLFIASTMSPDPLTGLVPRLWKAVASVIALSILIESPTYRTMTKDSILLILEESFVPDLSLFKTFVVSDKITDLVLILGTIVNADTEKILKAPCYIPRTVQKIRFPNSAARMTETKILIIPNKDVDEYDVMNAEELISDMFAPLPHSFNTKNFHKQKRATFKLGLVDTEVTSLLSTLTGSRTTTTSERS